MKFRIPRSSKKPRASTSKKSGSSSASTRVDADPAPASQPTGPVNTEEQVEIEELKQLFSTTDAVPRNMTPWATHMSVPETSSLLNDVMFSERSCVRGSKDVAYRQSVMSSVMGEPSTSPAAAASTPAVSSLPAAAPRAAAQDASVQPMAEAVVRPPKPAINVHNVRGSVLALVEGAMFSERSYKVGDLRHPYSVSGDTG